MCGKTQSRHTFMYKISAFEPTITTWRAILGLVTDSSLGFNTHRRSGKQIKYWELLGNKLTQSCKSMIWPHLNCHVLVSSSQKKRYRNQDCKKFWEKQRGCTMVWNQKGHSVSERTKEAKTLQPGEEVTRRGYNKDLVSQAGCEMND